MDPTILVGYLAREHPTLLARLTRNVRVQGDVARLLVAMNQQQHPGAEVGN